MFKTVFLQKNVNNLETLRQIFLQLQQMSLRALSSFASAILKSNNPVTVELAAQIPGQIFILKCNANTFVKVDTQIGENCRWTISYLQGYSCPKLQLQETE